MIKDFAALFIGLLALTFTIYSFWWMNWRRGRLHVSNIRTYAAASKDKILLIELPLIFYNSGARPILIENLRLNFKGNDNEQYCLFFNATVQKLATDENRGFATPFAVHGGKALELICEFQCKTDYFGFREGSYDLTLEALVGHKEGWQLIRGFQLNITEIEAITLNTMFKAYDNIK